MKSKKVTIEQLARMVQKGFENVDKNFENSEKVSDARHSILLKELVRISADLHDLNTYKKFSTQGEAIQDKEIRDLSIRLMKLETVKA